MEPPLALGQAVHETVESLSRLPVGDRFTKPLIETFETVWQTVSGLKGGFRDSEIENNFKKRARTMINRIMNHPGPLLKKAIKIRQELPYFWLSEEENLILCGKIDWLEYDEFNDSVRIIDFKTGKFDEDPDSLQLPIYYLLATHTQSKKIDKISYWYLDRDDEPVDLDVPGEKKSHDRILEIARKIALARKLGHFKCRENGCRACRPYESVIAGKSTFVGLNDFGQDVYII
jgi:ATP-dependent exoDNAse (exonuclease V) beta subunit